MMSMAPIPFRGAAANCRCLAFCPGKRPTRGVIVATRRALRKQNGPGEKKDSRLSAQFVEIEVGGNGLPPGVGCLDVNHGRGDVVHVVFNEHLGPNDRGSLPIPRILGLRAHFPRRDLALLGEFAAPSIHTITSNTSARSAASAMACRRG